MESKDRVLDAMHLVPVPLAAGFLGVSAAELHNFRWVNHGGFGEQNRGAWRYSLNELLIFAKHPRWFSTKVGVTPLELSIPAARDFLYFGSLVDVETVCAYLNIDKSEAEDRVCHQGGPARRRRYRVSDVRAAFNSSRNQVST